MKVFKFLSISLVLLITSCALLNHNNKQGKDAFVVFETTAGNVKVKLYAVTPKHQENMLNLVDSGFYDSLLFHRVIPKFMIQGGDPTSKNARRGKTLGNGGPGYTLEAEILPDLIHKRGALAAARLGDDVNPEKRSSGSQFYIVQGRVFKPGDLTMVENNMNHQRKMSYLREYLQQPENKKTLNMLQYYQGARMVVQYDSLLRSLDPIFEQQLKTEGRDTLTQHQKEIYSSIGGAPHLDGGYTVFGEVVEGMEVVDKICGVERDTYDRPLEDVRIISAKRVKK